MALQRATQKAEQFPAVKWRHAVHYKRLTRGKDNLVVNGPEGGVARAVDGELCAVKFLRPRPDGPSALDVAARGQDDCNEKQAMRYIQLG